VFNTNTETFSTALLTLSTVLPEQKNGSSLATRRFSSLSIRR